MEFYSGKEVKIDEFKGYPAFITGHIYKIVDSSLEEHDLYVGAKFNHKDILISLVNGLPWSTFSIYGTTKPNRIVDVTDKVCLDISKL